MEWLFKAGTERYVDLSGLYRCVIKRPVPKWFVESMWNPHFMSSDLFCLLYLLAASPACMNELHVERTTYRRREETFNFGCFNGPRLGLDIIGTQVTRSFPHRTTYFKCAGVFTSNSITSYSLGCYADAEETLQHLCETQIMLISTSPNK